MSGEPLNPYVALFAPKNRDLKGGIQADDLNSILKTSGQPVLHELRRKLQEPPAAPTLTDKFPPPPKPPGERPRSSAEPQWKDYQPKAARDGFFGALGALLDGSNLAARRRFDADHAVWKRRRHQLERDEKKFDAETEKFQRDIKDYARQREQLEYELDNKLADHARFVRRFEQERTADLNAFDGLLAEATAGDRIAIERTAVQACAAIPMPLAMPAAPVAHFDETNDILLLDVAAPNVEEAGVYVQLKTKQRPASDKEIRAAQEFEIFSLTLRILHEIFSMPELSKVQMAGVNMRLAFTDRRNGKRMNEVVASLAATREELAGVDVSQVDPRLCFRSLKGIASPSFQEPAAVRPLLSFGAADGRIVEGREIVEHLEQETNLAVLDWEDFEHIVRELFAKLFSERSEAEVHVTRASRDYGVDALIFDPDPIHGGKFVIQAKRYVNTVDVAAVRDLYGTVQNEGANRGYLVTTSSFGPEAHTFAKGKPLTLVDGAHLLHLLKQHGYTFRIDLQEARQVLHGR